MAEPVTKKGVSKAPVVPSAKALVQKQKEKKRPFPFLAVLVVVLIVVIALAAFFLMPAYKYSFNINGVDFVSTEYTPLEFFSQFKDNNSFLVIVNFRDGASNSWAVNAMELWIVALNADHKSVQTLVRSVDSSGSLKACFTNDANVLVSRALSLDECALLFGDESKARVIVSLGGQDTAIMSANRLEVIASGTDTISHVNYYAIKEMYADFDHTLALVNEHINSVK